MKAYVINLARSPERRAFITAQFEKATMPYEVVKAVDGKELDVDGLGLIEPGRATGTTLRPALVACALSHLKAYQTILRDDADVALVVEDDVTLPTDLVPLADEIAVHMRGAEVVLLNFNSAELCRLSIEGSVPLRGSRLLVFPVDLRQPTGATAYLITRKACEHMARRLLPVRTVADDWYYFYQEGLLERVRCVEPRPVSHRHVFPSTIGSRAALGVGTQCGSPRLPGHLRDVVSRSRVPILRHAAAFRRRFRARKRRKTQLVHEPPGQLFRKASVDDPGSSSSARPAPLRAS